MTTKEQQELLDKGIEFPVGQKPIARHNLALDSAQVSEDGTWMVVRTMKQALTFNGDLWFVREFSVKAIDNKFDKASETTHTAVNNLMNEYNNDFWSKGEWEGTQYAAFSNNIEKDVEERHSDVAKDISDPKA